MNSILDIVLCHEKFEIHTISALLGVRSIPELEVDLSIDSS